MRRLTILIILLLTLALSLPASAEEQPPAPYKPIIDLCRNYLYGGMSIDKDSLVSDLIPEYDGTENEFQMLAYDLIDFDKDEVPEMVLVGCYQDRPYEILDIYSVQSDEVVKQFEATETSKAFITNDGYTVSEVSTEEYEEKLQKIEYSKIETLYTYQIQPGTVVNMECWHEYDGTEVKEVGTPLAINGTALEDGTIDYVIPVTVKQDLPGMKMAMIQYVYLNTTDFPARVPITINDLTSCLLFRLSEDGGISIEQTLLDEELEDITAL